MSRTAFRVAHCRVLPDGEVPEWIELLPGAQIEGVDGRRFRLDDPTRVIAAFRSSSTDLVVDWEHASEILAPAGHPAPAAGWIRELEMRGAAMWGRVEWTKRGAESVRSREYRYVSPAFVHANDGSILELVSVGLTNHPNLDLTALNRAGQENLTMDPELLKLLGLPTTATAADAIGAVKGLQGNLQTALNRAEAPSLEKFVPRADYELAMNRVKAAETQLAERVKAESEKEVETLIATATTDGKITPATAEFYRAMCRKEGGLALFREFLEKAPKIADGTITGAKPAGSGNAGELNETQLAICRNLGVSPETFKKTAI